MPIAPAALTVTPKKLMPRVLVLDAIARPVRLTSPAESIVAPVGAYKPWQEGAAQLPLPDRPSMVMLPLVSVLMLTPVPS